MKKLILFGILISLTFCRLQADYILQVEFKANSDQVSPSRIPLVQDTKLSFKSGENEINIGVGSVGIDPRYEIELPPTHRTSCSIRINRNDTDSKIKITYAVNQETGEVVTSSLPVEIKYHNYRFKSHPNNPYTLIIKLRSASVNKNPE